MNYLKKLLCFIVVITMISCSQKVIKSPNSSSTKNEKKESECYNVDFISAARKYDSQENLVQIALLLTPKEKDCFPPIIGMGIKYCIGKDGEEIYVAIDEQTQGPEFINLELFGKDVEEKEPFIYKMVKNKVDFDKYDDMLIMVFNFRNKIRWDVKNMCFKYGLWEKKPYLKNKERIRIEKRFEFEIEVIK